MVCFEKELTGIDGGIFFVAVSLSKDYMTRNPDSNMIMCQSLLHMGATAINPK